MADIPVGTTLIELFVRFRALMNGMLYKRVDNAPDKDLLLQSIDVMCCEVQMISVMEQHGIAAVPSISRYTALISSHWCANRNIKLRGNARYDNLRFIHR